MKLDSNVQSCHSLNFYVTKLAVLNSDMTLITFQFTLVERDQYFGENSHGVSECARAAESVTECP